MAIGDSNIGLLFKIRGDNADARRAFRETQTDAKGLGSTLGTTGTAFSGLVGPATLAAGAVLAVGAGAIAGARALFDLAKSAADFGSEIFDASEKTGLSAETLSALKFAADQSGTSLDQFVTSASRFARTIQDAADGSEKAQVTLKNLGVTSTDLDTALQQALRTIVKLPPGMEQMTAAQDAFGRSGAQLLPLIKSFDGDLAALTAKARDLGVTIDDETARAADEFGDQLDTLSAQLSGVGRAIGIQLMPVFNDMARDISEWLSRNQNEIRTWGEYTADVIRGLAGLWTDASKAANDYSITQAAAFALSQTQIGQIIGVLAARGRADRQSQPPPTPDVTRPQDKKRFRDDSVTLFDEAEKDKAKQAEEFRKRQLQGQLQYLNERQAADRDYLKRNRDEWDKAFKENVVTSDQFHEAVLENERRFRVASLEGIQREYALKVQQEKLTSEQIKALRLQEQNEIQKIIDESFRREDEARKAQAEKQKKLTEEELADLEAKLQRNLAVNEAIARARQASRDLAVEKGIATEEQAAIQRRKDEVKLLNDELRVLETLRVKRKALGQETLDIDNEIKIQKAKINETEIKHLTEIVRLANEYNETIQETVKSLRERLAVIMEEGYEADRQKRFGGTGGTGAAGEDDNDFGTGVFDSLKEQFGFIDVFTIGDDGKEVIKSEQDFLKEIFADTALSIGESLGAITQGLGQMLAAWITTGKFSARAALEMVSGIAMGLAIEAGIKAIFQLAEGFAKLANPFTAWMAPMHFKAAATYGTVAAIAGAVGVGSGLAARAVGGGGGGAVSASGGAAASSPATKRDRPDGAFSGQEDRTLTGSRNDPESRGGAFGGIREEIKRGFQEQLLKVDVQIGLNSEGVLEVVRKDIRANGRTRAAIVGVVQQAA